MEMNIIIILKI